LFERAVAQSRGEFVVVAVTDKLVNVGRPSSRSVGLVAKTVFLIVLIVISMIATEPVLLLSTLAVTVIVTLTSGIPTARLLSSLKPLLLIIGLLFVFTAFTYDPSGTQHDYARHVIASIWDAGLVKIQLTTGGLVFGASFVMKILIMMFGSVYVIGSTPMEEILAGLRRLGFPSAVGLMAMIVFRFMPTMLDEVETIKDAQRARGAGAQLDSGMGRKRKAKAVQGTIPLFVPMIVSSMRRSDTLAMSMVSRGFGYAKHPTPMTTLTVSGTDAALSATLLVALVVVLIFRFTVNFGVL
jgi:energy-coupling factor transport system permease protein